MTSFVQSLANRENAQKSTGPKTDEGKFNSSLNRIVHGFRSLNPVTPGESEVQYATFKKQMLVELQPTSVEMAELAEQIVGLMWKRRRLDRMEVKIHEQAAATEEGELAVLTKYGHELDLLMRYRKEIRRELAQCRAEFRGLKNEHKALEKQLTAHQEEIYESRKEMARMDVEDEAKAKQWTFEQTQAALMQSQKGANEWYIKELREYLTERSVERARLWHLLGYEEMSPAAVAAMEGESLEETGVGEVGGS